MTMHFVCIPVLSFFPFVVVCGGRGSGGDDTVIVDLTVDCVSLGVGGFGNAESVVGTVLKILNTFHHYRISRRLYDFKCPRKYIYHNFKSRLI